MPDAVVTEDRLTEGRGNAGTVESMENQRRVSHAFHRPLEISQKARDSHISTARLRAHGKVENQKQVSHFPTAARDNDSCSLSKNQKPKKGSRPLRGLLIPSPFSLRSNGTDFMLIVQLENAVPSSAPFAVVLNHHGTLTGRAAEVNGRPAPRVRVGRMTSRLLRPVPALPC